MKLKQRFLMNGEDRPRTPMPVHEFSSTEELLALPYLRELAAQPHFSHFAKSDEHLMQVLDDSFWVVGYFDDPDKVDLPQWQHPAQ